MKPTIHPQYHTQATVTCACGNNFVTGSTKEHLRVEICGACHPFYTGKEKFVDTARRVEKFQEKLAKAKVAATVRKGKKVKQAKAAKAKAEKEKEIKAKKTKAEGK